MQLDVHLTIPFETLVEQVEQLSDDQQQGLVDRVQEHLKGQSRADAAWIARFKAA